LLSWHKSAKFGSNLFIHPLGPNEHTYTTTF
jgi:hypothetical protein